MTQAKIRIMPGRKAGLTSTPAFTGPQKTSASFETGAPVKLSSGNLAAVSTNSAGSILYVKKSSTDNCVGMAEGDAEASSTNDIVVTRIMEGMEFSGHLIEVTASASSAKTSKVGSTAYLANDGTDTHWGFSLNTPGASSASYIQGKITGLVDAASTVNGRVLVQITKGGALSI